MRIQKRLMIGLTFMFALLFVCVSGFAQETQQGTGIKVPAPPGEDTIFFISTEMSFDGKVVKGAPYSAQATTETTRTLADGNKIKNKTTASIYRDGEGRTRREQELGAVGPWPVSGEPQQTVFINDPVTGVNYVLDPRTHTARKMPQMRISVSSADKVSVELNAIATRGSARVDNDVFTIAAPPPSGTGERQQEIRVNGNEKRGTTESLGRQTIEGVEAEGTRTTMTIPAGEIGNEQPIQIVSERWYSPELQAIVMSRHTDPLVGETVYRLTNIVRGEPSRTLFEVPGDYTIKEAPSPTRVSRRKSNDEK